MIKIVISAYVICFFILSTGSNKNLFARILRHDTRKKQPLSKRQRLFQRILCRILSVNEYYFISVLVRLAINLCECDDKVSK